MLNKINETLHRFIHATGNQIDEITTMNPTSRDDFLFREGERKLQVYAELLPGNPSRLIDASSIERWLPPHENEPFTEEDKKRVLAKICKYFDKFKETYDIV